jgi:broad specificity phosphatase PhoE
MPSLLRYLTHPQVQIDLKVPVPDWGLSLTGRERTLSIRSAPALSATSRIVSSAERKAVETAEILAGPLGLSVEVRERMHENDRSATGFLPPEEFEAVANQFFAEPERSVHGWERAIDAQARIVEEVRDVMAAHGEGDLLLTGHGGVGTLLFCHFAAIPISRQHDQPGGGGNYFAVRLDTQEVLHGWRPMERI